MTDSGSHELQARYEGLVGLICRHARLSKRQILDRLPSLTEEEYLAIVRWAAADSRVKAVRGPQGGLEVPFYQLAADLVLDSPPGGGVSQDTALGLRGEADRTGTEIPEERLLEKLVARAQMPAGHEVYESPSPIAEHYSKDHMSIGEVSALFGLAYRWVTEELHEAGVTLRRGEANVSDPDFLHEMLHERELEPGELARRLGVSTGAVQREMRRHRVPARRKLRM